ncbi:hypothetical protein H4R35_007346, partial [Dimargaris xerosporica]
MAGSTKASINSQKKSGQKYQNATAYKHNRNSKQTRKILALPNHGLCPRCHDIVEWRKRYRKYKPLTVARKCVGCDQKKVKEAYHILCRGCSESKNVCAKCQQSGEIVKSFEETDASDEKKQKELENVLRKMNERQRRTFLRKWERGDITTLPEI